MAKNINNPNQEKNEKVGEAVSQTEEFFKKNGKKLSYTGVALILVAAIIVLVIQFYSKPMSRDCHPCYSILFQADEGRGREPGIHGGAVFQG